MRRFDIDRTCGNARVARPPHGMTALALQLSLCSLLPCGVRALAASPAALGCVAAAAAGGPRTETVTYRDGAVTLKGYLALPGGPDLRPGLVVFPEWWGLEDYARDRARQLAELGYVAFAADPYGDGRVARTPEEARTLSSALKGDRVRLRQRAAAALAALAARPEVDKARLGALGYCFGGTCALELARSGANVQAIVVFHAGLDRAPSVPDAPIRAPILVCHGAEDPFSPPEVLQAFHQEMRDAGADWVFVQYGSAVHGFTNPRNGTNAASGLAYNARADVRSWAHMRLFLDECLGPPRPRQ